MILISAAVTDTDIKEIPRVKCSSSKEGDNNIFRFVVSVARGYHN